MVKECRGPWTYDSETGAVVDRDGKLIATVADAEMGYLIAASPDLYVQIHGVVANPQGNAPRDRAEHAIRLAEK